MSHPWTDTELDALDSEVGTLEAAGKPAVGTTGWRTVVNLKASLASRPVANIAPGTDAERRVRNAQARLSALA